MLKRLLVVVDVLLVVGAGTLGLHLHRIWTEVPPATATPAAVTASTVEPAAAAPLRPPAPATAYTVIAERNLFSPTRTEVGPEPPKPTPTTLAAAPAPARPSERPRLYGVVIGADGGARAYLWDPQTRRTFGYKVGDSLAESRVEQIGTDRVTLRRGTDSYEVLLRDPSKPKPPPTAQAAIPAAPAQPPGVPGAETPPSMAAPVPGTPGAPPVPGQAIAPRVPPRVPRPVRPGFPGSMPVPVPTQPSGDTGS
jgi:hypothetical protein